jgi:hypothetical protein
VRARASSIKGGLLEEAEVSTVMRVYGLNQTTSGIVHKPIEAVKQEKMEFRE